MSGKSKIDLKRTPFGCSGSRHMVIADDAKLWLSIAPDGGGALFGGQAARNAGLLELTLLRDGKELPYTYETDGFVILVHADGGGVRITVDLSIDALRIEGKNVSLRLDGKNPGGNTLNTGEAADLTVGGARYYLVARKGKYSFDDTWVLNAFGSVRAIYDLEPVNGEIDLVAYNLPVDTTPPEVVKDFDAAADDNKKAFAEFESKIVDVPDEYAELKFRTVYSLWASYKKVSEYAEAVVASRINSPAVVASEQAIASLAFSDPDTAAKLIISSEKCYPPISGYAAQKIIGKISRKYVLPLHTSLKVTADWWLKNRQKDGTFFYAYRFETGRQNPQEFKIGEPVETPELYNYLYLLFDAVSKLDGELCNTYSETLWAERAHAVKRKYKDLKHHGKSFARNINTQEKVSVDIPQVIDVLCGDADAETDNAILGAALLYRASLKKEDK